MVIISLPNFPCPPSRSPGKGYLQLSLVVHVASSRLKNLSCNSLALWFLSASTGLFINEVIHSCAQ